VVISGAELVKKAGPRGLWCSCYGPGVAVRGGYRGPGVVQTNTLLPRPPRLTRRG